MSSSLRFTSAIPRRSAFASKPDRSRVHAHHTRQRELLRLPVSPAVSAESITTVQDILCTEEISQTAATTTEMFFSNNAPSWEELRELMTAIGTKLGDHSLTQSDYSEVGPPSFLASKRTFGKSEPIRVKLYHDRAGWCPFCQRVLILLEEKQIPYIRETVSLNAYGDKPESFLKISSSGTVPVIELDGEVVLESETIIERLEKEFPDKPLMPAEGTPEHEKAMELEKLRGKLLGGWGTSLGSRIATNLPEETDLESTLQEIENHLAKSEGPFLLGSEMSVVDIQYTSILQRVFATVLFYTGNRLRGEGKFPAIERWFAAMEMKPSYIYTQSDYYTIALSFPHIFDKYEIPTEGERDAKRICGRIDGMWRLPLAPLTETSYEPYAPGDEPVHDTYHAAKAVIMNHEKAVLFALRGCGKKVDRGRVTAVLADPIAEPGLHALTETDAALRHVVHAILVGTDTKETVEPKLIVSNAETENTTLSAKDVVHSLRYMRDRIGVPRDMIFPQARQLRAHINWLVDQIA